MNRRASFRIEHLNLQLPPGFAPRADRIGRQLAEQLSRLPLSSSVTLQRLALPPVTLQAGETDTALVKRLAREVHAQLSSAARGGKSHA